MFFRLAPTPLVVPLVVLATATTVIASQAVISGAYSMTKHAFQVDYLPRLTIRHTFDAIKGQIYVLAVNWILFAVFLSASSRVSDTTNSSTPRRSSPGSSRER